MWRWGRRDEGAAVGGKELKGEGGEGVGSLADVGSRSFGTVQKLFCRRRNPAGPEQVVRVPIRQR